LNTIGRKGEPMDLDWSKDLEPALARARTERKSVFLYFAKDP